MKKTISKSFIITLILSISIQSVATSAQANYSLPPVLPEDWAQGAQALGKCESTLLSKASVQVSGDHVVEQPIAAKIEIDPRDMRHAAQIIENAAQRAVDESSSASFESAKQSWKKTKQRSYTMGGDPDGNEELNGWSFVPLIVGIIGVAVLLVVVKVHKKESK